MQKVFQFKPIYKEKIWGGRKMESFLGRSLPTGAIGESWELSDYGDELSIICNGEFAGKTFRELYQSNPSKILGKSLEACDFPLLFKVIDAREKLSVQVHPDDIYAREHDPQNAGKQEAWTILQADPGSELFIGFSQKTDREKFSNLVQENRAEEVLQNISVKPSDSFLLKPGTIHAIGSGILLVEVQQSSDSTYRVYDYGRPRELHLEKALEVLRFSASDQNSYLEGENLPWDFGKRLLLTANEKFRMESLSPKAPEFTVPVAYDSACFQVLIPLQGELRYPEEGLVWNSGQVAFLSAEGMESGCRFEASEDAKILFVGPGSDFVSYLE